MSSLLAGLLAVTVLGDGPPGRDALGDPLPPGAVARLGTVRLRHGQVITAVAFSPDGKWIASGSQEGAVRVWDTEGKEVAAWTRHQRPVHGLAFTPDSRGLVSAASQPSVCLWDLSAKRLRWQTEQMSTTVWAVAVSPSGQHVAVGSSLGRVLVLDAATGKESFALGNFT